MMILTITIPTDDRNRRLTALPGTRAWGLSSAGRGGYAILVGAPASSFSRPALPPSPDGPRGALDHHAMRPSCTARLLPVVHRGAWSGRAFFVRCR